MSSSHFDDWQVVYQCPVYDNNGNLIGYNGQQAGGFMTKGSSVVGGITFDGKGNATGTFTQYGNFNQAASQATVTQDCPYSLNNGYAVCDPPTAGINEGA